MKIALISDIHGNLFALDAVLNDLDAGGVDQVICLGDVALFGPQPQEALHRVRDLGCPVVMGNTDDWALHPTPHPPRSDASQLYTDVELWGAQQLSADDLAFIRTFQPTVETMLGSEATLLCYHGSPRSFHDPIRADTGSEEVEMVLDSHRANIMAGGHTHVPMIRRHREMLIVNPGSVGLPYETLADGESERNPPWAEYAVVTWEESRAGIELRRINYDIDPLLDLVERCGMPHAEWWCRDWR